MPTDRDICDQNQQDLEDVDDEDEPDDLCWQCERPPEWCICGRDKYTTRDEEDASCG